MPRLARIGPGVGLFHKFLHMVFAKQVDGKVRAGAHLLDRAGLAGGAQAYFSRIAPGFAGGFGHCPADGCHIFGHAGQCFLVEHVHISW